MAINDLSGSLGYRGLVGAFTLCGVVSAAAWIRGLNPNARLPRYAPWLFLTPAAFLAVVATFISGSIASIMTVTVAVLILGAILTTRELFSAARLLLGVALLMGATGGISYDIAFLERGLYASLRSMETLMWILSAAFATIIIAGNYMPDMEKDVVGLTGLIPFWIFIFDINAQTRLALNDDYRMLAAGVFAAIVSTALLSWTARGYGYHGLAMGQFFAFGILCVTFGVVNIAGRDALLGTECVAFGLASLAYGIERVGPRTIVTHVRQAIDWLTKLSRGLESARSIKR